MSIMTELFVCPPGQAAQYDPESMTQCERVQLGGLTSLEFETLWSILEDETWDVKKHTLLEVKFTEENWIFAFPEACRVRLEHTTPLQIGDAAIRWAATDELAGTDPSDLEPVIENLVRLARSARTRGQDLFLWVSL